MDSMTKQRREGEANRPTRAKTGQRKLIKPSWTEFVRLADQAVVAIAGADMINRAEQRPCGCSRRSRRLDTKWPGTDERQLLRQTKPRKVSEGRRRTRLASSRTGENPPYGMNRGGGGNFGMTRGLFATMLERADTKEAIGLNRSRLRSTRPVVFQAGLKTGLCPAPASSAPVCPGIAMLPPHCLAARPLPPAPPCCRSGK